MNDLNRLHKDADTMKESLVYAALLIALNLPIACGGFAESMVYFPDLVMLGQWWRVLFHPFVHLTWYHLFLDGGAFFLIYRGIEESRRVKRVAYVVACGIGSLAFSTLASPAIYERGLCGLSGIAHGLMAVSALESITRRAFAGRLCRAGVISFAVVALKSIFEVMSGHVLFESLHFGMMGLPVPESHAGGVLSGVIAFLFFGVEDEGNEGRLVLSSRSSPADPRDGQPRIVQT